MLNQNALEPRAAEIIAYLLSGERKAEIARRVGVSAAALTYFSQRHAAELAPLRAEIERQVTDYAIAHQVNRIAALDRDWRALGAVIEARAGDTRYQAEPGYQTGLMVHSLKTMGAGKYTRVVDEFKVDVAVIAERRALARAAAEERDQLPRLGAAAQVNIGIAIQQYGGFDIDKL